MTGGPIVNYELAMNRLDDVDRQMSTQGQVAHRGARVVIGAALVAIGRWIGGADTQPA